MVLSTCVIVMDVCVHERTLAVAELSHTVVFGIVIYTSPMQNGAN